VSEIEGESELASLLAELSDDDQLRVPPPQSIWSGIVDAAAADRDEASSLSVTTEHEDSAEETDPADDLTDIEQLATTTIALSRTHPEPLLGPVGGWGRPWLPVAAAVAIAVAGGLVTWAFSDQVVDESTTGEVVASVEIRNDGLPVSNDETAEAILLRLDDQYVLELDVPELPAVDGYYEVWIIDSAVEGMFSLGVVTGDSRFTLPPTVDPAAFPIVDISVESADGNPTHGGQSIWRGVLDL